LVGTIGSRQPFVGARTVILAVPFTFAVATLIDVLVLDRDPLAPPTRRRRFRLASTGSE
jgi:hypothetical protein